MSVVRCSRGHYYDNMKFSRCPHCGIFNNLEDQTTAAEKTEESMKSIKMITNNLFSRKEKKVFFQKKEKDTEQKVQAADCRNTVAMVQEEADLKTISTFSQEKGNEFVTGWLVCIKGKNRGKDYQLYHGYNWIIRDSDMDICIQTNLTGIYTKICEVVYDDKNNEFYIVPDKEIPVLLNEKTVIGSCNIVTGDNIQIGESILEFIAFCRKGKVWENE